MFQNSRITDWQGRIVWLIGATSAFDQALARELHARGAQVVLSGDPALLEACAAPESGIVALPLDVTQRSALAAGCTRLVREHGRLDVVVRCAAAAGEEAAPGPERLQPLLDTVVPLLLRQGHGHLSLVAWEGESGSRGGPTRALVERLRTELLPRGIGVSSIHPRLAGPSPDVPRDDQLQPRQAARIVVEGLAAGQAGIESPRRPTMWQKLLGRPLHPGPESSRRPA